MTILLATVATAFDAKILARDIFLASLEQLPDCPIAFEHIRRRGLETPQLQPVTDSAAGWHTRMSSWFAGKGVCPV